MQARNKRHDDNHLSYQDREHADGVDESFHDTVMTLGAVAEASATRGSTTMSQPHASKRKLVIWVAQPLPFWYSEVNQ